MAGDWIKMRVSLVAHPRTMRLAECLLESSEFLEWASLSYGVAGYPPPTESQLRNERHAALRVTRYVVVAALLRFWGYANEHAKGEHIAALWPEDVDEITGVPGFANAIESAGWVEFDTQDGGLTMPNFEEHNTTATERSSASAERQKRYRERLKEKQIQAPVSDVTRDVTVTPREEKRREEKKETNTAPDGAFDLPEWIPSDTWAAYCKVRTGKKAKNEPHALGLIVKDLERFRSAGHDPVEVLNNSIKSGWAGVFEPKTKPGAQTIAATSHDPESRSSIEAEGVAKGIGPWNEINEQWHSYKARVRGKQNGFDLTQLAAMAAQRQGAIQ